MSTSHQESGLEFLRGILEGQRSQPPFAEVLNMHLASVAEGQAVFEGSPQANHLNPLGTVHGGWALSILDSAMACAVHSTCAAGEGYTTLEMKVNLVKAILPTTGLLRCEGRVVHRGRRVASAEGFLRDENGRLYAHGTETCMFLGASPST